MAEPFSVYLRRTFDRRRGVEMWRIADAIGRHDEEALAYAMWAEAGSPGRAPWR